MKAVYFICNNHDWGHVSWRVWDILADEGVLDESAGFTFCGQDVKRYFDGTHEYFFVPTDIALCLDYPRFLPEMNAHFADADMSGMVTWHEGGNAPFSVDVTPYVKDGANELKLLVWDPTDTHLGGTGKQVLELRTCFFPATSGICGSVWMETVPETYLADYKVETDAEKGTVTVTPFLKGKA